MTKEVLSKYRSRVIRIAKLKEDMQNVMQKRKNIMFRIHHIHIISHGMG